MYVLYDFQYPSPAHICADTEHISHYSKDSSVFNTSVTYQELG